MKPILFNTEMVRAFLANRKQVTRRVVKDADPGWDFVGLEKRPCELRVNTDGEEYQKELDWPCAVFSAGSGYCDYPMRKVPCRPGDILYVRETWAPWSRTDGIAPEIHYKADREMLPGVKWRPSIHMPREAARIFLRVTDVRVERLQDITELDILEREGVTVDFPQPKPSYMSLAYTETRLKPAVRKSFADLWDSTIKPADRDLYGWTANPWVWVITFGRISREEAGL